MNKLLLTILLIVMTVGAAWFWYGHNVTLVAINDAVENGTNNDTEPGRDTFVGIPDLIEIDSPTPGQTVDRSIRLSGRARGYWFFEATAPVTVTNWDGLILGEGYITAASEWMTESFVPFTGEVTFTPEANPYSATGTIIFRKDNPSGLPEHDRAFEMNVILPTAP